MKRQVSKEERTIMFEEQAKKAAQDLCGSGKCYCAFNCGHTNKTDYTIPNYGKGTVCPLAKYDATPDTRTFAEKVVAGEKILSPEEQMEQFFAICACCEYVGVFENGKYIEINRSEETYKDYCLDCPVQKAIETIQENMAEAAMS